MSKSNPKTLVGGLKVQASKKLDKKVKEELEADSPELSLSELQSLGMVKNGKRRNTSSTR